MQVTKVELEPSKRAMGALIVDGWQYTIHTFDIKSEKSEAGFPSRHEKQEGMIIDNSSATLLEALHKLTLEIKQLERRE